MFKKSILIIFIGLCVVVAVLVLGWSVFVKTEVSVRMPVVDDEVVDDDVEDDINNSISEIDISKWEDGNVFKVDTSDWKTYQNELYGYEIKFPQDWIIGTYDGKYGKDVKKSQERADWVSLDFHTKDEQKIENYQESLMASVNVAVINKSSDFTVEDYLKDFGYDLNSETIKDGRVLQTRGITETWMNIKEEEYKGHRAYIIQTIKEHGYYLYFEYNQNIYKITSLWNTDEINKQEILEIINTFKFIEEDDTFDWQTYKSEEFEFEVKYPKDWDIFTEKHELRWHKTVLGRIVVSGSIEDPFYAPIVITIRSNEKRLSIKEWHQENYPKEDISKLQTVEFSKTSGMRFSKRSDSIDGFYFSNEDKIYSISALDLQENIENQTRMTNQILSTFKFTEKNEISDWQTYRNEEFEFEYPSLLYFFDCSENFYELNPLHIHFTSYMEDDCDTPGKAMMSVISISIVRNFNKDNVVNLLDNNIKEEKITVGSRAAIQISGNREVVGGEGEKLSSAPIKKMIYTAIPFESNVFVEISYHRVISVKNNANGFYVGKDLSDAYNRILSTFKFTK